MITNAGPSQTDAQTDEHRGNSVMIRSNFWAAGIQTCVLFLTAQRRRPLCYPTSRLRIIWNQRDFRFDLFFSFSLVFQLFFGFSFVLVFIIFFILVLVFVNEFVILLVFHCFRFL